MRCKRPWTCVLREGCSHFGGSSRSPESRAIATATILDTVIVFWLLGSPIARRSSFWDACLCAPHVRLPSLFGVSVRQMQKLSLLLGVWALGVFWRALDPSACSCVLMVFSLLVLTKTCLPGTPRSRAPLLPGAPSASLAPTPPAASAAGRCLRTEEQEEEFS